MIPFPFNENRFSFSFFFLFFFLFFFWLQTIYYLASCVHISRAIGAFYHVWKWHNVERARSEMRRCTTHALYRSKLWQQDHCQHPQNANPDGATCLGWWKQSFRLWLWSLVWFQVRATSCHLTSSKSAWKSTPKCTWMCWRVWWSPGTIRWPVPDPGCGSAGPQIQRDPGLASEGVLWLCTLLSLPPSSPTWTRWTTSFGHTSRTSPTWPPITPKPAWSPLSPEYSPSSRRRLWKKHAPSSRSVSRRWLRLKAATLNRCQLYSIIKLPELIFSIKVLK